jgi:hypothetical protein
VQGAHLDQAKVTEKRSPAPLLTIPRRGRKLTLLSIGYGLLILFWLSSEDRAIWPVMLLGSGLSVGIGWLVAVRYQAGRTLSGWRGLGVLAVYAGLVGAATAALSATLMLLKTASHAHLYPDYPLPIILDTLVHLPAWSMVGFLGGLGIGLLRLAQVRSRSLEKPPQ